MNIRGLSETPYLKFGLDGEGGFFKITLSVQTSFESSLESHKEKQTKRNYQKDYQDSGVKKIFVICLAPSTEENYENVSHIWTALDINRFLDNGLIATDLKLANIVTRLMGHSSSHPCT